MKSGSKALRDLNEAVRALNASLEPAEVMDALSESVRSCLDASAFALYLPESSSGSLVVSRSFGLDLPDAALGKGSEFPALDQVFACRSPVEVVASSLPGMPASAPAMRGLAAALVGTNGALGLMAVFPADGLGFSPDDHVSFALLSAQAEGALRNARLHADSLKSHRELTSLARIGAALNGFTDTDELLREILVTAQWALGFSRCAILLREDDELVVRQAFGHAEFLSSGFRFPLDEGIAGQAFMQKGKALTRTAAGCIDHMASALIVDGKSIGVIEVESDGTCFKDSDVELLSVYAVQAATALRNANFVGELASANSRLKKGMEDISRMNEELREYSRKLSESNAFLEQRVRELKTLHEAGKAIASSLSIDDTLKTIMRMVNEIIDISSGAIMLLDEDTLEMKERIRFQPDAAGSGKAERKRIIDIPLVIGDKTIGEFKLASSMERDFSPEESSILNTLASQAAIAIENAQLFERTQRSYYDTVRSLASAIEKRDPYTHGHSERVTELAVNLGKHIGLGAKELKVIRYAGILHDIGKIGVSDAVLLKEDKLTPEDFKLIKEHPLLGDAILAPLKFLQDAQKAVKHHHERWDGKGYPTGLSGKGIPSLARIICIADAYDAMTTDRPYRKAMSPQRALAEIEAGAGSQFDPQLALAFIEMIKPAVP